MKEEAEIGIFGGTGIYDAGLLSESKEITVETPFGKTSDAITVGFYKGRKVVFMPRHGRKHTIPPHLINFRANIWALKEIGVKRIIAPSAVGSLKEELRPGDFVIPSQFIDFTKSRKYTFFEKEQVIHISVADPFCPELQHAIHESAKKLNLHTKKDATYICIEGPRFSTRAESNFYKNVIGADIIGMTLVPECQLAREAQICYASISTVTDYDVWATKPVTAKEVLETLSKNTKITKTLMLELLDAIPKERGCSCEKALEEAGF